MKLSEYNKNILKGLTKSLSNHHPVDHRIYCELLDNPEKAVLYIKHKLNHIRFIAKFIIEDKDITKRI